MRPIDFKDNPWVFHIWWERKLIKDPTNRICNFLPFYVIRHIQCYKQECSSFNFVSSLLSYHGYRGNYNDNIQYIKNHRSFAFSKEQIQQKLICQLDKAYWLLPQGQGQYPLSYQKLKRQHPQYFKALQRSLQTLQGGRVLESLYPRRDCGRPFIHEMGQKNIHQLNTNERESN